MKWNSLTVGLLALFVGSMLSLSAQPGTEHREFEATRARAKRGEAQAQFDLGSMYATGTGVTRDLRKAVKWHRQAAEQGLARAQFVLAGEYGQGEGIKLDKAEAFRWYRRAANQGLAEAQLAVGQCYAKGDGVEQDVVQAVAWYRRAASQNLAAAIGEVGECFIEGNGVATDIAEGVNWIRKAAELGYAPAQNRLGLCYLNGQGVTRDFVQAYKWFNLGAAQGGDLAPDIKVNQAKAASHMTPEQIAQAQRLTLEFKPGGAPAPDSVPGKGPPQPGFSQVTGSELAGGRLSVSAQDATYEVYVDGSFVGNPVAKLRLAEGSHLVEVKKSGFKDYHKEIRIGNGADLNLNVALEKQ